MNLGPTELIIILVIVLLLFGCTRLPKLAKSLGEAKKEFEKSQDGPAGEVEKKGGETVTMSKADLEALIAEREAKARREASSPE